MGSDVSHFNVRFINCAGQSHETVSIKSQFVQRKGSRSGESNLRPSVYQPSALPQAKPADVRSLSMMDARHCLSPEKSGGTDLKESGRRTLGVGILKNRKQRRLLAFKETNQNTQEVKMNAI